MTDNQHELSELDEHTVAAPPAVSLDPVFDEDSTVETPIPDEIAALAAKDGLDTEHTLAESLPQDSGLSIDELGDAFPREPSKVSSPPATLVESSEPSYEGTLRLGSPLSPAKAGSADVPAAPLDPAELADEIARRVEASALDGNQDVQPATAAVVLSSAHDQAWAELEEGDNRGWESFAGDRSRYDEHEQDTDVKKSPEPASLSGEKPLLLAVSGELLGKQYVLASEVTIGRSNQNAVIINDVSVSRQHATIYRDGHHYYLLDKNTVNGTFVGGKRVRRQRLQSGDELAFGKIRFVYCAAADLEKLRELHLAPRAVEDVPALAPEEEAAEASSILTYVLVSIAILLGALAIGLGVTYVRHRAQASAQPSSAQYFAAGVEAFEKRQWPEAQAQFNALLTLEPSSESGHSYLERIAKEKAFGQRLAAARAAFERVELLPAYTNASAISDSSYTEEAKALVREIEAELQKRVEVARKLIAEGKAQEALDVLATVEAVLPNRPEVSELMQSARKSQEPVRRTVAVRTPSAEEKLAAAEAEAEAEAIAQDAVKLFAAGKVGEAVARLASSAPGKKSPLLSDMKQFQAIYADATAAYEAKRVDDAIRGLLRCKTLEAKITGELFSTLRDEVRKKLADMYFMRGSDYWVLDRYTESLASFRDALLYNRNHEATRRRLAMMAGQTDALLAEAERMEQKDPAKAKDRYKLVLKLLPSSDARYRKAKQRLDAMP